MYNQEREREMFKMNLMMGWRDMDTKIMLYTSHVCVSPLKTNMKLIQIQQNNILFRRKITLTREPWGNGGEPSTLFGMNWW